VPGLLSEFAVAEVRPRKPGRETRYEMKNGRVEAMETKVTAGEPDFTPIRSR
jgi:hypothetical protein